MSCPSPTESCDDDQDNDCDGLEDCDDRTVRATTRAVVRPRSRRPPARGIDEDCAREHRLCRCGLLVVRALLQPASGRGRRHGLWRRFRQRLRRPNDCAEPSCVAQANCCNARGMRTPTKRAATGWTTTATGRRIASIRSARWLRTAGARWAGELATIIGRPTVQRRQGQCCEALVDCRKTTVPPIDLARQHKHATTRERSDALRGTHRQRLRQGPRLPRLRLCRDARLLR